MWGVGGCQYYHYSVAILKIYIIEKKDDTYHKVCKFLRYILNKDDLFNKITCFTSKKNKTKPNSSTPNILKLNWVIYIFTKVKVNV